MHRSPGHHVSEIINRICVRLGKFEERDSSSRPPQIQLEVGNVMESVIAKGLAERFALDQPDRYIHGLELERDGVTGNLDLLDTVDFAVEECKCTKYSIRHDVEGEKFWHYWRQLQSYCYMIGSNIGRLHVVFINGNYKYDPTDPNAGWQYRVWEDKWTDAELMMNWRMIVGNKKKI